QYEAARHAAGFAGPNDVILQIAGYVADTAEKARREPEASTMRGRRLVSAALHRAADPEAFERLKRISEVPYDEVLARVAYGTPWQSESSNIARRWASLGSHWTSTPAGRSPTTGSFTRSAS